MVIVKKLLVQFISNFDTSFYSWVLLKSKNRGYDQQNWRIYGYLHFKTKMGVAGLLFEPRPPDFENLYTFKDVQIIPTQDQVGL